MFLCCEHRPGVSGFSCSLVLSASSDRPATRVGPFLPIEQAVLSYVVTDRVRTDVFAWYTLAGSLATAIGALTSGTLARSLQQTTAPPENSYRMIVIVYAGDGCCCA